VDLLIALALLGAGLLAGGALGYHRGRRRVHPAPPLGYLAHLDRERRAGYTPAAPYLIIRADDPGAPLEVQYHE
jgi:hypothetical protein